METTPITSQKWNGGNHSEFAPYNVAKDGEDLAEPSRISENVDAERPEAGTEVDQWTTRGTTINQASGLTKILDINDQPSLQSDSEELYDKLEDHDTPPPFRQIAKEVVDHSEDTLEEFDEVHGESVNTLGTSPIMWEYPDIYYEVRSRTASVPKLVSFSTWNDDEIQDQRNPRPWRAGSLTKESYFTTLTDKGKDVVRRQSTSSTREASIVTYAIEATTPLNEQIPDIAPTYMPFSLASLDVEASNEEDEDLNICSDSPSDCPSSDTTGPSSLVENKKFEESNETNSDSPFDSPTNRSSVVEDPESKDSSKTTVTVANTNEASCIENPSKSELKRARRRARGKARDVIDDAQACLESTNSNANPDNDIQQDNEAKPNQDAKLQDGAKLDNERSLDNETKLEDKKRPRPRHTPVKTWMELGGITFKFATDGAEDKFLGVEFGKKYDEADYKRDFEEVSNVELDADIKADIKAAHKEFLRRKIEIGDQIRKMGETVANMKGLNIATRGFIEGLIPLIEDWEKRVHRDLDNAESSVQELLTARSLF
ncbi:hypothetical protein SBOR_3278 [Sclerotinia borealis F-4128]|uniref:Uncharacterized protein n=1 Tax=Sclerotinia borealis (strain F-4128) TaxID=1432307 RepID=W9CKI6_SCLBF|nr:hypothetical protein SBOR_3278 [Sclerotinia borealis F-4128]